MATISVGNRLLVYRLLVEASRPVLLRIVGYDPSKRNTTWFDRGFQPEVVQICKDFTEQGDGCQVQLTPFRGRKWFEFPLPILPDKITFRAYDQQTGLEKGVRIVKNVYELRPKPVLEVDDVTARYIEFLADFCKKAGYVPTDIYTSHGMEFTIRYLSKIRNRDTGELKDTPAQVSHANGLVEIAKEYFKQMTVGTRFFVGMHERAHFKYNMKNESECDLFAAKICLGMGMSKIECLYALSKLFAGNADKDPKIKTEQENRVRTILHFIQEWEKKEEIMKSA